MADTGFKFPGTAVGNRTIAGADQNFVSADNIKLDDAINSTCVLIGTGDTSFGLAASNFDFSSIPSGDRIDGIEIKVGDFNVNVETGLPVWAVLRLILADGSDGAVNRASELPIWADGLKDGFVGVSFDHWGQELTRADVTDPDFGFFIGVGKDAVDNTTFSIDYMQMKIYHSPKAFPNPISANPGVPGFHPPATSAGAFYAIALSDAAKLELNVLKSADALDSFFIQDVANAPVYTGSGVEHIAMRISGTALHIAVWATDTAATGYYYNNFNLATGLWTITKELIENPAQDPTLPWIDIDVRAVAVPVVVYNADTDNIMGGKKERVDVNVRNGGTWDGSIALDAGGDIHYGNPALIRGSVNRMHIIWQMTANIADPPNTWTDVEGRTLDTSDVLSAVDTDVQSTTGELLGIQHGVSYDDGGTQRMMFIGGRAFNARTTFRAIEDGSDNLLFEATDIDTQTPFPENKGEIVPITIAELNGDLHVLYRDTADDLYYTKSTDNGLTWDAPIQEKDGSAVINFVSATIYNRSGDKFAYIYDDSTKQFYDEKDLAGGITLVMQDADHLHVGDNLDLVQANVLAMQDSDHLHTGDNLDLVQANVLAMNDADHLHDAENLVLDVSIVLVMQDSDHLHTGDNLDLIQANLLVMQDADHLHAGDNLDLVQANVLAMQDSDHLHTGDNLSLVQANVLAMNDADHLHDAENIVLDVGALLVVQDSDHLHAGDNLDLVQANVLAMNDADHLHDAENLDLVQANVLAMQDSDHLHDAENLDLDVSVLLDVADAFHLHVADNLDLVQANVLAMQDSDHLHDAENLDLTQANVLVVDDSDHLHTGDNIILSVSALLVVQDADHLHDAENLDLIQAHVLAVDDSDHLHIADNLDLFSGLTLIVNDATHQIISDNLNLFDPLATLPEGLVFTIDGKNRIFFINTKDRVFLVLPGDRV